MVPHLLGKIFYGRRGIPARRTTVPRISRETRHKTPCQCRLRRAQLPFSSSSKQTKNSAFTHQSIQSITMFPWQQPNSENATSRPRTPPVEEKKEDGRSSAVEDGGVDKSLLRPSTPQTPPSPQTPSSVATTEIGATVQETTTKETAATRLNPAWTEASHSLGYRQLMSEWTSASFSETFRLEDYCSLPLICVMGDTSSGKSTVLSQLTGIALPANCQLTTKCPTLMQLQPTCDDGNETTTAMVSVQWHASSRHEKPKFLPKSVTNWQELPSIILEAQAFLLQASGKAVTPDRVVVQVRGPTCPSLTLVDLPGTVHQAAANESPTLPQEIDAVLQEYWSNPEAIFLVVLPSNVDFHNAALLAKALRQNAADRTIPVLTKPDLIDRGAEAAVGDLLTGKNPLLSLDDSPSSSKLAFHMIKGRGQAALDRQDSLEDALRDEEAYFATTEPWKSIADRSLFGTTQLRNKLANRQFAQVQKAVRVALERLKNEHISVTAELDYLGVPVTTPVERRRSYQEVCQSFATQLHASLSGKGRAKGKSTKASSSNVSAAASLHEACKDFMAKIQNGSLATIQRVVEGAHVLVTSRYGTVRGECVHLDTDFCCVDYVDERDAQSLALFEATQQTSLEFVEENDVWSDGTNIFIARSNHVYDTLRKIPLDCVRTDPSWLKDRMAEHRTDDLACFLNVDVFQNIVQDFIEVDWRPHCVAFLERLRSILQTAVEVAWQATVSQCSVRRYPQLQQFILQECDRVQSELLRYAQQQVDSHLRVEQHPYTQDDSLFRNLAALRQKSLRQELQVALGLDTSTASKSNAKALSTTAIAEIIEDVFTRHESKSVEDHLAAEMEMVLASYGQIATRRVIDRTPMIGWEVFRSLTNTLQETLWSVTDDKLTNCFQDEMNLLNQYTALTRKEDDLRKAISIFQGVPVSG